MQAHRSQIAPDHVLPRHARRAVRRRLRHRVVLEARRDARRRARRSAPTCSKRWADGGGPGERVDPHRLRPADRVRRRRRSAGSPSCCRAVGCRRVMFVTTAGRAQVRRRPAVVQGRRSQPRVDVRPGGVRTCPARSCRRRSARPGATASTASSRSAAARAPTLGKAVDFFIEQEQGVPGHDVRRSAGASPHRDPDHLLGRRAHTGVRHDRPVAPARSRARAGRPRLRWPPSTTPTSRSTRRPRVSAETGMNALGHCVEVVWSTHRTPEADAIALAGVAPDPRWRCRGWSRSRTTMGPHRHARRPPSWPGGA